MIDLNKDTLIKEVADKSKVFLDKDDPIFALVEMNGILMKKYTESLDEAAKNFSAMFGKSTTDSAELMEASAKDAAVKTIHSFHKILSDSTEGIARIHGEHLERIAELKKFLDSEDKGISRYLEIGLLGILCLFQVVNLYFLLKL